MSTTSTGLARLTISSPQRRVDVALPADVPLAGLLPELLARAGDGLADDGQHHGGWVLRRFDGTVLTATRSLAVQGVRDGEILHLAPVYAEWPELEYDDVVEAIAAGSRRYGLGWSPAASRVTGLVVAGAALLAGVAAVLRSGPPWPVPFMVAVAVTIALLFAGAVAARAYGHPLLGATLAGSALPYAFAAGLVAFAAPGPPAAPGAPQLLVGSVALGLAAPLGALAAGGRQRIFVAGATVGVLGAAGALVGLAAPAAGAGAVVLAGLVTGIAGLPLLAIRLGQLPVPVPVPVLAAAGPQPRPHRDRLFAAVARTDEILTGALFGLAAAGTVASAVVAAAGGVAGRLLVGVAATTFLLRARLFVTVRQRVPLLGLGVVGFAILAWVLAVGRRPVAPVTLGPVAGAVAAVVLLGVALAVAVAGFRYAERAPSPYLGRAADVLDALCVVTVLPLACGVLGLYGVVRDLVS